MLDQTKVLLVSKSGNTSTISVEPLERGYGHTLGNSLRRVLLNSLPGAAVVKVKIKGAPHQFMTVDGMAEDVVDLLLNVKKVRVTCHSDEPVTLKLTVNGPKMVTAGDISANPQVQIVNPELELAHLADAKAKLDMELVVERGVGYVTVDERLSLDENARQQLGEILLDAHYSPIYLVNYKVESARVGRITNFDKLLLDVTTDGTISGLDAVKSAAKILASYFSFVSDNTDTAESAVAEVAPAKVVVSKTSDDALTVDELELAPKIANRLKENGYETVNDLVEAGRDALLKLPNFGEKSLKEVEVKLKERGYTLKENV